MCGRFTLTWEEWREISDALCIQDADDAASYRGKSVYESHATTRSLLTGRADDNLIRLTFEPNAFSFSHSGMKSESLVNKMSLSKFRNAASCRASQQISTSTPFSRFEQNCRNSGGCFAYQSPYPAGIFSRSPQNLNEMSATVSGIRWSGMLMYFATCGSSCVK